jgi:predicted HTH transcriptional regulator
MSLQNQILKGEGKNLEFKAELPSSNKLANSILAFSNTVAVNLLSGLIMWETLGLGHDVNIF